MLLSLVNRAEQSWACATEVVANFSWKTDSIRAEVLLYAADRAQHVEEVLNPRLAQGQLFCAIATLIPLLPTRVMVGVLAKASYRNSTHCHRRTGKTLWLDVDVEVGRHGAGGEHLTELSKRQSLFIERCSRDTQS